MRVSHHRQQGAVLIIAMLLLTAITVLSTTAVSMSVMEMRMSSNTESDVNTFQTAMGAVDFVLSDLNNLPASGPLNVPTSVALSGAPFSVVSGDSVTARAVRIEDCAPPPRMASATSMTAYSSFRYEVDSTVAKNVSGMGNSGMTQGYLLLGPKC